MNEFSTIVSLAKVNIKLISKFTLYLQSLELC